MPGNSCLWNENSPAETDIADAAPIRSIVTSVRVGLTAEHTWPTSTGPGFGIHLLGSARPFYDVQSNVSSAGTDGRLLVTSDTSRLFHVGSTGTMYLGGQNDLSVGSAPVGGQRFYWATEFGEGKTAPGGSVVISIPNSGYSGIPFVLVSASTTAAAGTGSIEMVMTVTSKTATVFQVNAVGDGSNPTANVVFNWLSFGTRTF